MSATQPAPLFGANVDPSAREPREPFERARLADDLGLDLIGVQDHPYNPAFLETWTLVAALATATRRVHVLTNVLSTPLRPPAMLAKAATTLDVLTGGRVELGLGAGAFERGIVSFGGAFGSPAERYKAFKESLEIIRGMWASAGGTFSYAGEVHRLDGALPGPAPAHPIRIWTGALGPRMLRLTGSLADGLLVSSTYVRTEQLPQFNRLLDEGAAAAGRPPTAIRRGYNVMGLIEDGNVRLRAGRPASSPARPAGGWTSSSASAGICARTPSSSGRSPETSGGRSRPSRGRSRRPSAPGWPASHRTSMRHDRPPRNSIRHAARMRRVGR